MARNEAKLVIIKSTGKIPQLGGMIGPLLTPTKMDISVIISLINGGKIVYEVNPANKSEMVRLDRLNVRKTNFAKDLRKEILAKKKLTESHDLNDIKVKRKNKNSSQRGDKIPSYQDIVNPVSGESKIAPAGFAPNRTAR